MVKSILRGAYVVSFLLLAGAAPIKGPAGGDAEPAVVWSCPDTDKTPSGTAFHGPFLNETVMVSAVNLPAHDWLAISVDLLILRTWDGSVDFPDGNRSTDGPDYLRIGLLHGPTLMYTTFSNTPVDNPGFNSNAKTQNFPSQVPGEHLRPQTGSAEHNTLGYNYPYQGPPQPLPMDAVYHLRFVVPHHDSDVSIQLSACGLTPNMIDENWGVRKVSIHPMRVDEVSVPDETTIAKSFADALNVQGNNQADACSVLTSGGDATVSWIERNVRAQPIDAGQAKQLLIDLIGDDNKILQRSAAGPALRELGPQAEVFIRDVRREAAGEVRARCDEILQQIGVTQLDDEGLRRVMLASRMLEIIGSPKATALRQTLVGG